MMSRKSLKGKKSAAEPLEDKESEWEDKASTSLPKFGCSTSSLPSSEDTGMENEDDQANLTIILKELRAIGQKVKEFRKDTNQQLLDICDELDKNNARLDEVDTRAGGHEDKLQNSGNFKRWFLFKNSFKINCFLWKPTRGGRCWDSEKSSWKCWVWSLIYDPICVFSYHLLCCVILFCFVTITVIRSQGYVRTHYPGNTNTCAWWRLALERGWAHRTPNVLWTTAFMLIAVISLVMSLCTFNKLFLVDQ